MLVQAQVRHQALQLRVLIAQLSQLAQLLQSHPRILLLPQVKRLLTDPMLAADFHHRVPRLRLPQHSQNLLFAVSSLRHLQALLSRSREPRQAAISQLPSGLVFGFWVSPFLARFTDVAAQAGLAFQVVYGGLKHKNYIIETVGSWTLTTTDGWISSCCAARAWMSRLPIPVIASTKITGMERVHRCYGEGRLIRSGWAIGVTVWRLQQRRF